VNQPDSESHNTRRVLGRGGVPRGVAFAVALGFSAGCATARPGEVALVSDRPDFTEAVETVAPKRVQLEGGYTFTRVDAYKSHTTGEALVRIGVAQRAELRLEIGSYSTITSPSGDVDGFDDAAVGMKFRLYDGPKKPSFVPSVSLIAATSVPTGSAVFRQQAMQPEAKLATSWTLSDRLSLGANFNGRWGVEESQRYMEWSASGSLGVSLTEHYGMYAEVFGFDPRLDGASRRAYGNAGLTAGLTPNFQLDLRAGVGFNGAGTDYFVGAGFARRW
jgi:hypothetical protein